MKITKWFCLALVWLAGCQLTSSNGEKKDMASVSVSEGIIQFNQIDPEAGPISYFIYDNRVTGRFINNGDLSVTAEQMSGLIPQDSVLNLIYNLQYFANQASERYPITVVNNSSTIFTVSGRDYSGNSIKVTIPSGELRGNIYAIRGSGNAYTIQVLNSPVVVTRKVPMCAGFGATWVWDAPL